MQTREGTLGGGSDKPRVQIAKNLKRVRVMINSNGDEIDPVTKQVIKRNMPDQADSTQ